MSIVQLRDASMSCQRHARSPVLRSVRAEGSVKGLLFELSIEQCYVNASPDNIEAVYSFPVPWDSVLLGVELVIGDKVLQGAVVAKADAERRYEGALEDGDTAVMVERAADGLYTASVGNLMPGEQAVVRFRYAQLLSFTQGHIRLVIPTVISPRYGDAHVAGLQPHQVPVTDLMAEHLFSLGISLYGDMAGAALSSPSHGISVRNAGGCATVALSGGACLDRDFVLLAEGLAGKSLSTSGRDGDGYIALASFCPSDDAPATGTPLNLKILVDCSGSMNGDRITAARHALHEVLSHLEPADSFSFSRFGSEVKHFSGSLLAAMPRAIIKAGDWIATTQADMGGTEIRQALLSTFALGQPFAADVLLITDGDVWEADAVIASAGQAGQRVFAVGIGSAPASSLLHSLARRTGGACELVAANSEVQGAVLRMFRRMRRAPVHDVNVEWAGQTLWQSAPGRTVPRDETVHQFAGFAGGPPASATLRWSEGEDDAREISMPVNAMPLDGDTLARVAAAARMDELTPPERHALALRHGLVGATTGMVLVHRREDADRAGHMPALHTVAHMVPAGWGGLGVSVTSPSPRMPAVWRREDTSARIGLAQNRAGNYDVPAFLRSTPAQGARYAYRDILRRFAETTGADLVRTGAAGMTTLDALSAELPEQVIDELREIVLDGCPEPDVIRAFVLALLGRLRADAVVRRVLGTLLRIGSGESSTAKSDLERRVTAIMLRAYDVRDIQPELYDIPEFLRRRAD